MKANYAKPKPKPKISSEEYIRTIARNEYKKQVQNEVDDTMRQAVAVMLYSEYLSIKSTNIKYIKRKLRKKIDNMNAAYKLIYCDSLPQGSSDTFDVIEFLKRFDIDLTTEIQNNIDFVSD